MTVKEGFQEWEFTNCGETNLKCISTMRVRNSIRQYLLKEKEEIQLKQVQELSMETQ